MTFSEIVSHWVYGQSLEDQVITLFEKVRDIPYGSIGSRDPFDVFKSNKGTCSGKHELLKGLYHEIGIETKDYIATHAFNDLNVDFPQDIRSVLDRGLILDPHNFFKINYLGKWVIVDVTWEKPLAKIGFPVNVDWDGSEDMDICVVEREVFEVNDPIEKKKEIIHALSEDEQVRRKLFLNLLTNWLETLR